VGSHAHHRYAATAVACAVVTVSDTRTPETDVSGARIRTALEGAGHSVVSYAILPDEPSLIREHVERALGDPAVRAVIVNGGTGIAPRDTTYEALTSLLEKRLEGFGELFRMLSWEQVGAAAMLSRAAAGVARGKILVSLPGSPDAVGLAMDRLLVPELGHMARLLER
jgi:molybdenum cofactor biosynthesis protein B